MVIPKPELSLKEKDRRWYLLKQKLKKAGMEAIIIYGGSQLGVPVHYLTRIWGTAMNLLVFPVNGEPVFLVPTIGGQPPEKVAEMSGWIPPENIRLSPNPPVDSAKLLISMKLQHGCIGIDGFQWWPVFDREQFTNICPKIELVEAHRLLGEIRGAKSAEELTLMQKAIKISDLAHYAFLLNLKDGITEAEASRPAVEVLDRHGIGDRLIMIHTQPEVTSLNPPGPAVIKKPNPITYSPEFTRQAGYGVQMVRAYWWEEPKGILKKMFELWADIRQTACKEFRPGAQISDVGRRIENLVAGYGFECSMLGHAVGLSYADDPYINTNPHEKDYQEWTIQANEVYVVHPMVTCKGNKAPFSMIGDMYLVGQERTTCLTTALSSLPEIIPE